MQANHPKLKIFNDFVIKKDPKEDYRLLKNIGSGTYGEVYKAENRVTKVFTAIKVVKVDIKDDVKAIAQEIYTLRECKHENIVEYYGSYLRKNKLWICMEFCGGFSMQDIYTNIRRPLNENCIAFVTRETLRGLAYMHSQGKIHRDIKGANILLTVDGFVKIADFGVAAQITETIQKRSSFIGTPYWMAPEVAAVERKGGYDEKCDIWAVGITSIEYAELQPPMFDLHPMKALHILSMKNYKPPVLQHKYRWTSKFHTFLKLCLNRNEKRRPTATDMLKHELVSSRHLSVNLTRSLLQLNRNPGQTPLVPNENDDDDDDDVDDSKNKPESTRAEKIKSIRRVVPPIPDQVRNNAVDRSLATVTPSLEDVRFDLNELSTAPLCIAEDLMATLQSKKQINPAVSTEYLNYNEGSNQMMPADDSSCTNKTAMSGSPLTLSRGPFHGEFEDDDASNNMSQSTMTHRQKALAQGQKEGQSSDSGSSNGEEDCQSQSSSIPDVVTGHTPSCCPPRPPRSHSSAPPPLPPMPATRLSKNGSNPPISNNSSLTPLATTEQKQPDHNTPPKLMPRRNSSFDLTNENALMAPQAVTRKLSASCDIGAKTSPNNTAQNLSEYCRPLPPLPSSNSSLDKDPPPPLPPGKPTNKSKSTRPSSPDKTSSSGSSHSSSSCTNQTTATNHNTNSTTSQHQQKNLLDINRQKAIGLGLPPTPKVNMGAGFSLIFEGCPLKINATATWIHPITNNQILLFGANEGIYYLPLDELADGSLTLLFPRRCLWLYVVRGTMMSLSGKHPQLYNHNLILMFKLRQQGAQAINLSKLLPRRFLPTTKIASTKGCQLVSIARNPYSGAKYLCAALQQHILVMEWFSPINTFMEVKRVPIHNVSVPLLNFDLLVFNNKSMPLICLGVYTALAPSNLSVPTTAASTPAAAYHLHLIDLNISGCTAHPLESEECDIGSIDCSPPSHLQPLVVHKVVQLEFKTILIALQDKIVLTNLKGQPKVSRSRPSELKFDSSITSIVCLKDSLLAFHNHGLTGRNFNGQLTQQIDDPSSLYRLIGSDKNIVVEKRSAQDPMDDASIYVLAGHTDSS